MAEPIREAFASCGFETDCKQDIKRLIWQKMLTNVSASVLTGVLQVPLGFIAESPNAWAICGTLVREAVAVAAGEESSLMRMKGRRGAQGLHGQPAGLTSIYADLRDGRRTEVDTISGSVIRASERNGVPRRPIARWFSWCTRWNRNIRLKAKELSSFTEYFKCKTKHLRSKVSKRFSVVAAVANKQSKTEALWWGDGQRPISLNA